ncbi:copper resistance CopC family protein [Arthrobacter sp. M4]|uniref:copper resistance CopC family protein n=1 Tax=Arthrobacter sp. M4 TaxID=218160 RepID=UPI001CDC64F3|nr:copper resistance CopC family protein [Arthrobacter sp. M4]MCA4134198.1 copper resistance protein CopC [Arthrobacter sp. M4]
MRAIRTLSATLTGALALVAGLLFSGPAASAHDAAESSSPANGSTVAAVPDKVSVTFNNRPLSLGAQIAVNDEQGRNWADGAVEIVDNTASQKVKPGAPAGAFTVVWRVVSSDSHPIEGTFRFTASGQGSTAAAASGGASPAQTAPVASAGSAPATAGTGQPQAAPDASQPFPWSIVGFAAVALVLLVILAVTARRRLAGGDEAAADEVSSDRPESSDHTSAEG